jgi:hypothetical protein
MCCLGANTPRSSSGLAGPDDPYRKACNGPWVFPLLYLVVHVAKLYMPTFNNFSINRYSGPYVGNVPANTRLGIPSLNLEDGPQVC